MKIKPTGDRKRKGVGVGKGDGEKKCVSFLFLPLCLFFGFFPRFASWSFSRAHQIVQNKKNVYEQSRFLWSFQSFTPSLSLTSIHRKFADHRLSLRVKTRHRPTSNPIKKLMSRDDIRSELWVQFVSWRDLGTATAPHRIPRQSICGTFTKGCIIICLRKDIFLWNVCILLLFSEWKSGENYLLSK